MVRKDATFTFETNQYSVPHTHARSRVTLHVFADRLEVYANNECICVHRRSGERGQLILDEGHYQARPQGPRKRRSTLQARFEDLGPVAPAYLRGLARERGNGGLREQAQKILLLAEIHGKEAVHAAMVRAHHFGSYSYATIRRILEGRVLPDDPRALLPVPSYTGPTVKVQQRSLDEYSRLLEVSDL